MQNFKDILRNYNIFFLEHHISKELLNYSVFSNIELRDFDIGFKNFNTPILREKILDNADPSGKIE